MQLFGRASAGKAIDFGFANLNLQRPHANEDFAELEEERLEAVVAEVHFLDEADALVAAARQALPGDWLSAALLAILALLGIVAGVYLFKRRDIPA
jgi:hypothetical protein